MLAAGDKCHMMTGRSEFGAEVAAHRAAAHYRNAHDLTPIGRDCNLGLD